MSKTPSLPLPFGDRSAWHQPTRPSDQTARDAAVDPRRNVVLEASAGTGKTRVLVDRYLRLAAAGVEPANILAITFTRKAAAEMRQRIAARLREEAIGRDDTRTARRRLADRLGDVAISTIDAFCLSLLHEFPLEADVDPGFDIADETALPRLADEALDKALRICRKQSRTDPDIALLFAQLGEARLREGLAALLDRRLVAEEALRRVLGVTPKDLTVARACADAARRIRDALVSVEGGFDGFLARGPVGNPRFALLAADLRDLVGSGSGQEPAIEAARLRALVARLEAHLFTTAGDARRQPPCKKHEYPGDAARRDHWAAASRITPAVGDAIRALRRDLNAVLSRAVRRVFGIAADQYRRTLDAHGVLDFAGLLAQARAMLDGMPEFGRSRYLLESRYQHVLVDEFQDTSRAQWELIRLLVRSWGEGLGMSQDAPLPPSIFIVGDRKQSIYGFRDAEVAVLGEAAGFVGALRPDGDVGHSISHSFRSVPALLAFANDLFDDLDKETGRADAFRFEAADRFPVAAGGVEEEDGSPLGLAPGAGVRACAGAVAAEIARLIGRTLVRDRQTGLRRPARPGDIAILFRTRESHREFEQALETRAVPTYVYKGLGFFDTDEILDIVSVVRFLADPASDLRAAALLRSRIARLSDRGLQRLAPGLARALTAREPPASTVQLDDEDRRVLDQVRSGVAAWLALADRVPPAELIDRVLGDTGYSAELRGPRLPQSRENVKKLRALVRRLQNRGYLTLARLAAHLERMSAGDESNAVVDALDAVNLMTVHAAKGLEFPIVFAVNLARGTGGHTDPIRVAPGAPPAEAVAVGDFHTAFDEDALARDREETKRLLYVAVTRARDRLYLSSSLEDGRFQPGKGSLGEVLPASVKRLFEQAGAEPHEIAGVEWVAASGGRHHFRVCRPAAGADDGRAADTAWAAVPGDTAPNVHPAILNGHAPVTRTAVTTLTASTGDRGRAPDSLKVRHAAIAGRLIHRLFQTTASAGATVEELQDQAGRLLDEAERQSLDETSRVTHEAATIFRSMRSQPGVRAVLDQAECHYEVPFSMREADGRGIVRGVIDCIAIQPGGAIVVLDFKAGSPRRADAEQLAVYERAVRALCPGARVEGKLVYPAPGASDPAFGPVPGTGLGFGPRLADDED
ncbi:MAG: UvrD-helicase domain-containing protein [Acidobacteriota bacterium]